ncbi:hypothetical protein NE237_004600 [Protea cynaroides]|uniref:Uncharacterized protein n=1 Tax=Protea cynaroides TaxID=273540 RepID=A0A9Q0KJ80_9MAGN|nr:hypothetical protein NE237_004600 [Protea cynaroides]
MGQTSTSEPTAAFRGGGQTSTSTPASSTRGGGQSLTSVLASTPVALREHDLPLVIYETGKGWARDERAARVASKAIVEGTQPNPNPNPMTRKKASSSSKPAIEVPSGPLYAAWGHPSCLTEAELEGFRNMFQIPLFVSLQLAELGERSYTPRHEAMAMY